MVPSTRLAPVAREAALLSPARPILWLEEGHDVVQRELAVQFLPVTNKRPGTQARLDSVEAKRLGDSP
jgi:hypothetical protein